MMAEPHEISDDVQIKTPKCGLNLNDKWYKISSNKLNGTEYRFYNPIETTKYETNLNDIYYYDPTANNTIKHESKHSRFMECSKNFSQSLHNNESMSPFRRKKELSDEIRTSFRDYLQRRTIVKRTGNEFLIPKSYTNQASNKSSSKSKNITPCKRTSLSSNHSSSIKPVTSKHIIRQNKWKAVNKNNVRFIPKNLIYNDDLHIINKKRSTGKRYFLIDFDELFIVMWLFIALLRQSKGSHAWTTMLYRGSTIILVRGKPVRSRIDKCE